MLSSLCHRALKLSTSRCLFSISASHSLSPTHQGVAFENRSLVLLEQHLSMSLTRVGGTGDGGIDLLGWWWLPAPDDAPPSSTLCVSDSPEGQRRTRLRVLAQCKDERQKVGPKFVRELEGVLLRFRHYADAGAVQYLGSGAEDYDTHEREEDSHPSDPVVGLLISSSPFSKASLLRAHSSPVPLALLQIPLPARTAPSAAPPEGPGPFGMLVFNPALGSTAGLLRGRVQPRWEYSMDALAQGVPCGQPALWCDGQRVRSWTPEHDCINTNETVPIPALCDTSGSR